MRIDPESVYLRLEPSVCIINRSTGKTRYVAGVEIHWKDGSKWQRRTFVAPAEDPSLAAALRQVLELVETYPAIDDALATLTAA